MDRKLNIRTMPQEDHLLNGQGACAGCGVAIAVKNIMRVLGENTTVYVPASCLLVFGGGMYPHSAFDVPFFYSAFENTGAVISGIKAGYRRQGKDVTVIGIAGDGGTFDIGLQALSGAAERNEDVIYVCVDNEAYMNTGTQRSGSTPFGAWTTTTPVGKKIKGKQEFKKDLMSVVTSQDIAYAATLSIAHMNDFVQKVDKAKRLKGFRFLHVMTPCPSGWKSDPSLTYDLAKMAVETGMWSLYEVEDGEARVTYRPKEMAPVTEYLKLQGRFKHMGKEDVETLQAWICKKWNKRYCPIAPPLEKKDEDLAYNGDHCEGV
ncbi:MAG: thiamine pyrophosphate-dependent enzyme [Methanomassiliicoccales archaeon]|nr:thiamine pyrophosphate-dependent enzyme [Methanomassiliicoccales archaeon]